MNDKPQVLIVEDLTLADYLRVLRSDEYQLTGARSLEEALTALDQQNFDVVVTDLELFDQADGGMQVVQKAQSLDATIGVIMITGVGTGVDAQHALSKLGAHSFLRKPLDFALCRRRIHEAIQNRRRRLTEIEAADYEGFVPIHSPYMAGPALRSDNVTFYGRDELFDFIRENVESPLNRHHMALVGPSRIGKTSILIQLPTRLDRSAVPVYIDCQSLGIDPGMPAFFLRFSRQIRRSLQGQNIDVSGLPTLTDADLGSAPSLAFSDRFLSHLWQVLGDRSLVLCLDEFEELVWKVQRGRLDPAVFAFLRELMLTEEKIVVILAGTRRLEELEVISREAASILEMVAFRRVGVLSRNLARRLIEEPVAHSGMYYRAEAIDRLQQATGGYPYLIQLLCGRLVERRNAQKRNEMTLDDVNTVIKQVVEGPEPGFFWSMLTPHRQAVLIATCHLAQQGEPITSGSVERQLQEFNLSVDNWPDSIPRLLQKLTMDELLQQQVVDGISTQYTLSFDLLSAWVRRQKAIDQIREGLEYG